MKFCSGESSIGKTPPVFWFNHVAGWFREKDLRRKSKAKMGIFPDKQVSNQEKNVQDFTATIQVSIEINLYYTVN